VILCQVPPGFTRGLGFPGLRLFYQVETLIFGRAVERALNPERFIVGGDDPEKPLPDAFEAVLGAFGCPVLTMLYESAELAKIAINCCLVASISTANTLAELCEKIGADWSEIVPALKLDKRIGPDSYLSPGLGLAGGNLERDLATVLRLAQKHGTDAGVVRAWVDLSAHRNEWAAEMLKQEIVNNNPEAKIAVWGLAYKENTDSTKNSPSLALFVQIDSHNFTVFDPVVPAETAGDKATGAADAMVAVTDADVLLIMTPWPEFKEILPSKIAAAMKGKTVIDPYGVLDTKAARDAGLDYFTLGRPPIRGES
jgi:UDPglucose 6-dehydrogenase